MFCRKCGAKLKDSAKFCGKCGAPVAIAVAPEEKPKLIVNMPGAKPVSSNGEFDRWFSDPGNL